MGGGTVDGILKKVEALGIETEFTNAILNFSSDPEVMRLINEARAAQGLASVIVSAVKVPEVRIIKGFDKNVIDPYVEKMPAGTVLVLAALATDAQAQAAKDYLASKKIDPKNFEVSRLSVAETLTQLVAKRDLQGTVITQIMGAELLEAKLYAQLLAGTAGLGIVVVGEKDRLSVATQVLNVAEIVSAAFEAAQAVAHSA